MAVVRAEPESRVPSMVIAATVKPVLGVMVYLWFAPLFTTVEPGGVMLPPPPTEALMAYVVGGTGGVTAVMVRFAD